MGEPVDDGLTKEIKWQRELETLSFITTVKDVFDGLEKIYQDGEDKGESTGWPSLDEHYTVQKGELCIVTGIPTHGKSCFLDNLLVNLARREGWRFVLYSPENKPYQRHAKALIEAYTGKAVRKEWRGEITKMPLKEFGVATAFVNKHFKWLDIKNAQSSIDKIIACFQHMAEEQMIDGFVIDPWNTIEHMRPKQLSETEYISLVLSILLEFAREKQVALWLVVHPTKQQRKQDGTFPVPSLNDCAGSATWRSKADVGIVVHRENIQEHNVDIHVQKVRFKSTGKPGTVRFDYHWDSGRFIEKRIEGEAT